jgi:hypothetical protein
MKISYAIHATIEGEMAEVIAAPAPKIPALSDVLASLKELAFIVETVAHLQGKERELLPAADNARALIARLS